MLLATHLCMRTCRNYHRSSVVSAVQRSCGPGSSDRILIEKPSNQPCACLGGEVARLLHSPSVEVVPPVPVRVLIREQNH